MKHHWIGLVAAVIIAGLGYYVGAPIEAVFLAVAIGTLIEFTWLRRPDDD